MDGRGSKFNIRNSGNRRVPFRYAGYFLSSVLIIAAILFLLPNFTLSLGSTTIPGGVNTGLGYPKVSPSSPMRSTNFTISCPTNQRGYNCIASYANRTSNRCTFTSWSGNSAVFACAKMAAGNYVATCQAVPGTSSNCKAATTQIGYTIVNSLSNTITTTTIPRTTATTSIVKTTATTTIRRINATTTVSNRTATNTIV